MNLEINHLIMVKRLVFELPTISWFFVFNLVCFFAVAIAGVSKFISNNYILVRLPFCLVVIICFIYQMPLVLYSKQLELSLRGAWAYALIVNGAAMLLMGWVYLSRRFDLAKEKPVYPQKIGVFLLITGILGITLIWSYLAGVPWECSGLYALVFDPSHTMLARELGGKLIGTSLATYSLGTYAGAVAPLFILLSLVKLEQFVGHRNYIAAFVCVICSFIAIAALLVGGVKGLLMPSTLTLAVTVYFYKKTWLSRFITLTVTAVLFFCVLSIFELLKERNTYAVEGKYDFAACSVKVDSCDRSMELLGSMKGQRYPLGLPNSYVKFTEARLACLCTGEDKNKCLEVSKSKDLKEVQEITRTASKVNVVAASSSRLQSFTEAIWYRAFVVPFQVSVWHFMYAETEAVDGLKTLPFARRIFGHSLNMPEIVYQKYGSIYWQGDKTTTSSAPTSFIWTYSAYLGWMGFGLALACILSLDLFLIGLTKFAGAALTPILIGLIMIMSMNFLVSDFVTVLLSHGGLAGIIMMVIYALLLKWRPFLGRIPIGRK